MWLFSLHISATPTEVAVNQTILDHFPIVDPGTSPAVMDPEIVPASPTPALQAALINQCLVDGAYAQALQELSSPGPELERLADYRYYLSGEALFGLGQYTQAADNYLRVSQLPQSRWTEDAAARYAQSLRAAGNFAAAAEAYASVLAAYPNHPLRPALDFEYAQCLTESGKLPEAAERLQLIWLDWPTEPEANKAQVQAQHLLATGISVAPPTIDRRLYRIHELRRGLMTEQAIAELEELKQNAALQTLAADWQLALTYKRTRRFADAVQVLREMLTRVQAEQSVSSSTEQRIRRALAESLALNGEIAPAVALITADLPTRANLSKDDKRALHSAASLLAALGQYQESLSVLNRLSASKSRRDIWIDDLAWISYRAGDYTQAVALWGAAPSTFSRYWVARALQKSGNEGESILRYRTLVDEEPFSYYGILAKSRLIELGQASVDGQSVCQETEGVDPHAVLGELERMSETYAEELPGLQRAMYFWSSGAYREARDELRVVAAEYSWSIAQSTKPKTRKQRIVKKLARQRLTAARATKPTISSARMAALRKVQSTLTPELGHLLYNAGVPDWAWRFLHRDAPDTQLDYPLAYASTVFDTARRYDLDPNMLWGIMRTESFYRPDALSRVGAVGLMQLMPHTGRRLAIESGIADFRPHQLLEPEINLNLSGQYLKALERKFHGQLPLMVAAYNGGAHNVADWLTLRGKDAAMDEFVEEIPFDETRGYVKKVVARVARYESLYCGRYDRTVASRLDATYEAHPDF